MFKSSDFTKPYYKSSEVMKILNITFAQLKYCDTTGRLKVQRSEKGRRIITREALLDYLDSINTLHRDSIDEKDKSDVIYARVSSNEQKAKGDLDRQVSFLAENAKNLKNLIILKEVGSGLNDKRSKFISLLNMVQDGKVSRIFVTYKDRLTRFGFNYIKNVCDKHNTEIVILKDVDREKSIQEELAEDMMSLLASFSGKLYGIRSLEKRRKEEKENVKEE